ncbi:MAG: hypothetical protein IPM39_25390 [Chloroflexi bacterium]|nr:hypothetical protein [Chloroflexota bacterium]
MWTAAGEILRMDLATSIRFWYFDDTILNRSKGHGSFQAICALQIWQEIASFLRRCSDLVLSNAEGMTMQPKFVKQMFRSVNHAVIGKGIHRLSRPYRLNSFAAHPLPIANCQVSFVDH